MQTNEPQKLSLELSEPKKSAEIIEWSLAERVADLCKKFVRETAVKIGDSYHVPIEGWQSIAAAYGFTAGTDQPERVEGGWRCKATLKRDSDGAIISTAYGFVGDDEPLWMGRQQYAREGMVQTRASSRVLAQKFRFVTVLMKIENLKTTPAEEMTDTGSYERPKLVPDTETTGVIKEVSFGNGYWGFYIDHKRHWTSDEPLGTTLDKFRGLQVLVRSIERKKEGKPSSYQIVGVEAIGPVADEMPDDIPYSEEEIETAKRELSETQKRIKKASKIAQGQIEEPRASVPASKRGEMEIPF